MEWISVKDRLPDPSSLEYVLAYGIPTCHGDCERKLQIQFCRYSEDEGFEFGEYDCGLDTTHWMPLPDPPKGV